MDGVICIAVIHHLATESRRIQAIREIVRILRTSGRALIYVWAKNQKLVTESNYLRDDKQPEREKIDKSGMEHGMDNLKLTKGLPVHTNRTQFMHQDVLVPWKVSRTKNVIEDKSGTTFLRYYHVFEQHELESLCETIDDVTVENSYYDNGNWCVVLEKV